ncbi:MAG: cytochrome c oxidase assembly protein, partial [Actinomycetota bacterium]|nr:cytochrome c oxidase assembly protein [Actinomycetota bacterium]
TLAVRSTSGGTRTTLARVAHGRVSRFAGHPVTAWVTFATVMWLSHLPASYDAALESEALHALEHAAYLGASLLFWNLVAGVDPSRARLSRPVRVVYLLAALPVQSFLGLAIYSATTPLYEHYETVARVWGPTALEDQRLAGTIMWIAGDLLILFWVGVAVATWLRAEERAEVRVDRRLGG